MAEVRAVTRHRRAVQCLGQPATHRLLGIVWCGQAVKRAELAHRHRGIQHKVAKHRARLNLVFRLGYKGPGYAANFATEKRVGGMPHEKPDIYIERSPLYHVDKIKVPVAVHVATNDQDVNFVEDQQMIHALEYHIPKLAETKIYVDPPGGHSFDRLVNAEKTAPQYTIPQRDSLNRIWTFLEANLRPYLDGEK